MSNYTKTTNFAAKDSLPSGNANKIVKGTEIDTEFDNIATASATKADIAGPTFTGTVTIPTVDLNGGAIDGTTVGASTAAAITGTTIVANTSINIAGDGATVTGIKDEDDMSSNSATKLATQQSIKAYVDSQVTAQDLDFQADSGGALSIDLDSETLTFTGGTGVDTSGSGNAVTFAIDSTVATLTGTQTLTNKTLTSPTLNTPTIGTSFTIGSATITEAELEILDGATVTTAELNVLDGITSTTAELNILDGVTSTAAELNILDGVTSTAAELNILDGVTSTAAELNILDGVTATTAELNIMDGVTATTAELNYVDGVTSNVQTQLDAKAPIASPTFTGTVTVPALTTGSITTTGDINFGDADKAIFGGSTELQIFHDGNNSFINNTAGTSGSLSVKSHDINLMTSTSETMAAFVEDGAVTLFHDNSARLATTSTGVDVTGTATTDGLTVAGNAYVGAGNYFTDSTSGYFFGGSGSFTNGVYGVGTNNMAFNVAGSRRMLIASNGDISFYEDTGTTPKLFWDSSAESLGIGTTTQSGKVTVDSSSNDGLNVSVGSNYLVIKSQRGNDGDHIRFFNGSGATVGNIGTLSSALTIGTGDTGIQFNADNNAVMPHNITTGANVDASIDIGYSSGGINRRFKDLYLSGIANIGTYLRFGGASNYYVHSDNANYLRFGTAGTERMRIDSSGNVELKGGQELRVYRGDNATYGSMKYLTGSGGLQLNDKNGDGISFVKADGATEYGRFDGSGNLLVGTTTTSSTVIGAKILPSGRLTLVTADSGTQYPVTFGRETTGAVGSITTTASATAYNTSSDQRLKENIVDAPSASDDIDAIQVRSFDWKADGSHQKYGMVAQELQSVAPEAVSAPEDPDEMMGVDYSKLVPMLVKEIQSLRARVAQLEN